MHIYIRSCIHGYIQTYMRACQECPLGLECTGTDMYKERVSGSEWVGSNGQLLLSSCPSGYRMRDNTAVNVKEQQCGFCGKSSCCVAFASRHTLLGIQLRIHICWHNHVVAEKGEYCAGTTCKQCLPCRKGTFKEERSQYPCTPCPRGTYNTRTGQLTFASCKACPGKAQACCYIITFFLILTYPCSIKLSRSKKKICLMCFSNCRWCNNTWGRGYQCYRVPMPRRNLLFNWHRGRNPV